MKVYKSAKTIYNHTMKDIKNNKTTEIEFDFSYHEHIDYLMALFVEQGFVLKRKVSHIDNMPKEMADRLGFESLSYDTNDQDDELKFIEDLSKAYCLEKDGLYIQICVNNICGEWCYITTGSDELLYFPSITKKYPLATI